MKTSNVFMLFAKNFTTAHVVFPQDAANIVVQKHQPIRAGKIHPWKVEGADISDFVEGKVKTYTYLVDKSLKLVAGDRVLVDSPSKGLIVVYVAKVDDVAKVDLDASFDYKFIVQKVDTSAYDAILAQKLEFDDAIRAIEMERQREKLQEEYASRFETGTKAGKMFADLISMNFLTAPTLPAPTIELENQDFKAGE